MSFSHVSWPSSTTAVHRWFALTHFWLHDLTCPDSDMCFQSPSFPRLYVRQDLNKPHGKLIMKFFWCSNPFVSRKILMGGSIYWLQFLLRKWGICDSTAMIAMSEGKFAKGDGIMGEISKKVQWKGKAMRWLKSLWYLIVHFSPEQKFLRTNDIFIQRFEMTVWIWWTFLVNKVMNVQLSTLV